MLFKNIYKAKKRPSVKKTFAILFFIFISQLLLCDVCFAQPANDNCANASVITISNAGFGTGIFNSTNFDITNATVQPGEAFAPAILAAGQTQKSIWYKFTLPTTRSVSVTLTQPGTAINEYYAGFTVYKTSTCLPGSDSIPIQLSPIPKFGNTFNPCVGAGVYLVQVSSTAAADGLLGIQLDVEDSTGAVYDHPNQAYDFGTLATSLTHIDFSVGCQSLENAAEVCTSLSNYQQYTQSTWHTFTTPAYFDYLSVLLGSSNANCLFTNGQATFGYNLYKGDAKITPIASLTLADGCDSFVTNGTYVDKKIYRCGQLQPNTTYSIQIFYNQNFNDNVRLTILYDGTKPTQAPQPISTSIPASNQLGTIVPTPTGVIKKDTDYLACNSRHVITSCGPSLPINGITARGYSYTYDLSTFFTFTISSEANVSIAASSSGTFNYYYVGAPPLLVRLYNQAPTANCASLDTANIIAQFISNGSHTCLAPGTYTIQVSGTDSLVIPDYLYCTYLNPPVNYHFPLLSNLGEQIEITITSTSINAADKFSLATSNAYDTINSMKALQNGVIYKASLDTFGCGNTVVPAGGYECNKNAHKAIFREFTIGDANGDGVPDSGVAFINMPNAYNNEYVYSVLYNGDASSLAMAQNAFSYPDSIKGLTPYTLCRFNSSCDGDNICLVPGKYTLVSLGDSNHVGLSDGSPAVQFNIVNTQHASGPTAQNMASLLDTLGVNGGVKSSDIDYFSCTDNAVTINGFAPPIIYYTQGDTATKAIYRQFYLKNNSIVSVCDNEYPINYDCSYAYYEGAETIALFTGKATDGLNTLNHIKINGQDNGNCLTTLSCDPLPAGWYTVVSYGIGPNYANPFHDINGGNYGGAVGKKDELFITVTPACAGPRYDKPSKAAVDTITNAPFLLKWAPRIGSTPAYPVTDTTYTLYTEHFNCTTDKPFPSFIQPCDTIVNRVAYYTFQITQESFVQINTEGLWGEVFNADIRTDSSMFASLVPVQPCQQTYNAIQLCRLQPGTYTLVIFAGDANVSNGCGSVTPTIYIDNTGYSRFDFAANAYDFGVIPADSIYYNGKIGDVNPLNPARAPSNDFFYCTTGAASTDPTNLDCYITYAPNIYNTPGTNSYLYGTGQGNVYPAKRDLWYSFVVDKPGNVYVKVDNKTLDKTSQSPFAIYQSNITDSLPLATHKIAGQLDSTIDQGLTFIKDDFSGYYCYANNILNFYVDPCSFTTPLRYFILVENSTINPVPNSQVEVSVLVDSTSAIKTKYDHYYQADTIGLNLGAGIYTGGTDNFTCASADPNDPTSQANGCAPKTLWYKITVGETGYIRYRSNINGKPTSWGSDLYLFQQTIAGDSTSKGLIYKPYTSYYTDSSGIYWAQQCISPGTYYLIATGCSEVNQNYQPVIWLMENAGDFCSKPVVATLNGAGSTIATAIVDCHTIGTDYGEFGDTLACPPNALKSNYKSTWFRIDVGGKDTLDLTAYLVDSTNANATDVNYRLMTGDCSAMQATSCVQDATTQNTYNCLPPGSYYVQVFEPLLKNAVQVTGTVDLHVTGVKHTDTCAPQPKCLSTASFVPQFDCTKDSAVTFVNYSTYGTSITYKWEFGNNGDTSSAVQPSYFYPALAGNKTYNVKLIVQNTSCGEIDSQTVAVLIPGRPYVNLGPDLILCNPDTSVTLDATSFAGATYAWNSGSTNATYKATYAGQYSYSVKVDYNGCSSVDTINIFINPLTKSPISNYILCPPTDSVQLYYYGNYYSSASYLWSTGLSGANPYYSYNQIYAKTPGNYWVDISYGGCTTRDSFVVANTGGLHPLGNDTSVCLSSINPYILDATVNGASSYVWQDGSRSAQYNVTSAGQYWVSVTVGSCTVMDTVNISAATPLAAPAITGLLKICSGDSTLLDAGTGYYKYVWNTGDTSEKVFFKTSGTYSVTVYDNRGCSAVSTDVQVNQNANPSPQISGNLPVCSGDSILLDAGKGFVSYSWNNGDSTETIFAKSPSEFFVKVVDNNGCKGEDSVMVSVSQPPVSNNIRATICSGKSYMLPSGKTVSAEGAFQDTLRNIGGCDSIITSLNLKIINPILNQLTSSICTGQMFMLPSGKTVNAAGIYQDTISNSSGCDSLITTLSLTVLSPTIVSQNASICAGKIYSLPSGRTVNLPGTYPDTLRSASGCDSLITTVSLAVLSPTSVSQNASICSGKIYSLPSGKTVNSPGTYQDTLRSASGCDSLITTLNLTVASLTTVSQNASICSGKIYSLPSGRTVNSPGTYQDTLRNVSGCDSLITTLSLTVFSPTMVSQNASICSGKIYSLPSGRTVNSPGTYQDTLRNVSGCDSLITTLSLTVFSPTMVSQNASICSGKIYSLPSGRTVNSPGTYQDTLKNASGCDSLITTLSLTVFSPTMVSQNASICSGKIYSLPSGRTVNSPGTYQDTLKNASGCDSLITTLSLTVVVPLVMNIKDSICPNSFYQLPSGRVVNAGGIYQDTIRNVIGCDSIITNLALYVKPNPEVGVVPAKPGICPGDSILLTAYGGDAYQWFNQGFTSLSNNVSIVLSPAATTGYHVAITSNINGCNITDTLNLTVMLNLNPVISITKSNDLDCFAGTAKLYASGGSSYLWWPVSTLDNANAQSPIASPQTTTVYHVQATSAQGCVSEDSIEVKVITDGSTNGFVLPNAFTPNGDGINDCFGVQAWGFVSELNFTIFDRWGNVVFHTSNSNVCWDGTLNGRKLDAGTFVYQASAKTICGKIYRKGTVILIR